MDGWKRRFGWYWAARAVSQFGDEISQLALPWLVVGVTGSALAVGALQALFLLPPVLLGLHLGVLADRHARRLLMQLTDVTRLVLLVSVVLAGAGSGEPALIHVFVVAFGVGLASAVFEAAAQPLLADIVPERELVRGNSRLSLTEGFAIVAGPPAAGVLIAALGASGALVADAATFGLSALCLLMLTGAKERISHDRGASAGAIRDGLRALMGHQQARAITMLSALANLSAGIVIGLWVLFLRVDLGLSSAATGLVFAINGVGVLIAGFAAHRLVRAVGLGRAAIAGIGCGAAGVGIFSTSGGAAGPGLAAIGVGLIGLGAMLQVITGTSYRQHVIPRELLGRVTAIARMMLNSTFAVGALLGGVVGELVSVRAALFLAAAVSVGVALYALSTPLNAPDPPELTSSMS